MASPLETRDDQRKLCGKDPTPESSMDIKSNTIWEGFSEFIASRLAGFALSSRINCLKSANQYYVSHGNPVSSSLHNGTTLSTCIPISSEVTRHDTPRIGYSGGGYDQ